MSSRSTWAIIAGAALVAAFAAWSSAGAAKPSEGAFSKVPPRMAAADVIARRGEAASVPVPLGKTVRLTFSLRGSPDFPAISVTTATQVYGIQFQLDSGKGLASVDMAGHVQVMDAIPARLLFTYKGSVSFEGADGAINVFANGSSEVELGGEARLFQVADKALMVEIEKVR